MSAVGRPERITRWWPAAPVRTIALTAACLLGSTGLAAQGVTTSGLRGFVSAEGTGEFLTGAVVSATHEPSGTAYSTLTRAGGAFSIPNMRVGGPYTIRVQILGYAEGVESGVFLNLGQDRTLNFRLQTRAVEVEELRVRLEEDKVLNPDRTGAATFVDPEQVIRLPSVNRSTRDLIRLDPRSDGNYSFGGRNWLFNNISLDGSYFNNSFGLDDPALGGQTASEPIPYDAVEEVEVSIAPFDVRESGFTGANVNIVTKSGTNEWQGTAYGFFRNEDLLGNDVRGQPVVASPDLTFNQWGATVGGPIVRDKAFIFLGGEIVRRDDPGTNFIAGGTGAGFGESRVDPVIMDSIRNRMINVFDYDPGDYQGFVHETDSDKLIAKFDWNANENNNLTLRYSYLNAERQLPPHPFVLSFANTGRGPNSTSLPFQNSGYAINNELNSFAVELNSRSNTFANRFFASYNRQRDFRDAFSEDFPTVEIGEGGVTYTTVGHEPFSINNILHTDTWQFTNNFSWFRGRHVLTFGANFELFSFFNSFNFARHGLFFVPDEFGGTTFDSLDEFFDKTDPNSPNFIDLRDFIGSGLFKGEVFDVGQLGFYAQDELPLSDRFNVIAGVRVDFPMYLTDPVDNPYSRGLAALDENRMPETVDQSDLAGATPLFSPRVGFNWDATGDRSTQVRGGTGIFTGRVPLVWVGNVFSNPGLNPNLFPGIPLEEAQARHMTNFESILQQSFDGVSAMDPDFKWPQLWVTNIAVDQRLPGGFLGTFEFMYGKDINNVVMRNADLVAPVRTLAQDGRPFYGGAGSNELNPGDGGIFVLDNTSDGYNVNVTAQLRKRFDFGLSSLLAYSFTEAKNKLRSTEIASVLWSSQPNQGDPNDIESSHSEFGQRHRVVGAATWEVSWSDHLGTQFGLFVEAAEGNRFAGAGGNRYSFIYSGDVNGDGQTGNDLIYIPASQSEILLDPCPDGCGGAVSPDAQWQALDAFIEQDRYLSNHRGEIAERHGLLNPWYHTIDLRVLQDIGLGVGGRRHTFQVSLDVLNFANLVSSDWGVRKVASPAATSPLRLTRFDANGEPVFNFTGPAETFIDDPSEFSRWRIQLGVKYLFN